MTSDTMDRAVIQFYRQLLKKDFENSGSLENPSIFIEAIGEKMVHCGNTGNYMQLYLNIADNQIDEIRYVCSCEPAANVAVEVLCTLVKGKTLEEVAGVSEEAFYRIIGSEGDELKIKVRGLLELLNEGLRNYQA
jgi:NifU-like protein involved in Fe-S cluster formation